MRFVSIALACFATAFAAPAAAATLHPMPERAPASVVRPMTVAATRGTLAGGMSPGEPMSILIHLQGQHENELEPFIATLQNPRNANPHYLTTAEYARYFGADPVSYGRAIAALRAAGFVIDEAFGNRTDIAVHAPAVRVEAFFGTPIDQRVERGRIFFTARYEPLIPAALGNAIVSGLDDYAQFHPIGLRRPSGRVKGSWTPDDIAAGYNLQQLYAKGLDGTGVTIANSTAGAANASDVAIFQQHFALPNRPMKSLPAPSNTKLSTSCGRGCGNGESSLDVASATSVARGATFLQVVAHTASNKDFDASYEIIVNHSDSIHVVTTSWGLCERDFKGTSSLKLDEHLLAEAASKGQFWFSASGDNGTDDCDNGSSAVSADFPGTSPYVISVGGTNVQANTDASGRVTSWAGETTWQYSNSDGASGGGKSIFYAKPSYQMGVTPNDGVRDVPDVALLADNINNGVYLCDNGQIQSGWGGTSESAPMWAAFLAIVEQSKIKAGKPLVDPHNRLYALAKSPAYSSLFHDVLTGNNGVPAGDDPYYPTKSFPGFNAGKGFDLATGWGSFNGYPLARAY